jgi:hypothetical protein
MLAISLVLSLLSPNPNNLAVDSWEEREAWTQLYSNVFSALRLPIRHEDAEVQHRIKIIRSTTLRELDPQHIERVMYEKDYSRWVKEYAYGGKRTYTEYETFLACRSHGCLPFFAILKPLNSSFGEAAMFFMEGGVVPGDFEQYLAHLLRYRSPATVEVPYWILKGVVGLPVPKM